MKRLSHTFYLVEISPRFSCIFNLKTKDFRSSCLPLTWPGQGPRRRRRAGRLRCLIETAQEELSKKFRESFHIIRRRLLVECPPISIYFHTKESIKKLCWIGLETQCQQMVNRFRLKLGHFNFSRSLLTKPSVCD